MSTALGIAGVSVVLADLLNNGFINADVGSSVGGQVKVSALPPDRVLPATPGPDSTQLNLFMYNVTPNIGWRNAGLPALNGRGERIGDPPLALDLHYLLTAFGEKDFYAEILLGYAMQLLHETPVLSRADVRRAIGASTVPAPTSSLPSPLLEISKSELADQIELIKITQEPLSTEELSKLWAAFQTHYRPTAAYAASVVLIESKRSKSTPLRVRGHNVYVRPFAQPRIASVAARGPDGRPDENLPVHDDSVLVLTGENLRGDATRVILAGTSVTPAQDDVEADEIALPLAGQSVRAGVVPVQVAHLLPMGTPTAPHRGVESNAAAFVLQPRLTGAVTKSLTVPDPANAPTLHEGTLTVPLSPEAEPGQRVALLLNEARPPSAPADALARAYTFPADPLTAATASVPVPVAALESGIYLARVQVDGAESPLAVDPSTRRYSSPTVVIP